MHSVAELQEQVTVSGVPSGKNRSQHTKVARIGTANDSRIKGTSQRTHTALPELCDSPPMPSIHER